jgi:hypothetical protein
MIVSQNLSEKVRIMQVRTKKSPFLVSPPPSKKEEAKGSGSFPHHEFVLFARTSLSHLMPLELLLKKEKKQME